MFRPTRVLIDLEALRHNLRLLKSWNRGYFFCPMLKANAYGHGENIVAPIVAEIGVDAIGVALTEEGLSLRSQGCQTPILSFASLDLASARVVIEKNITPVIGRFEDLEAIVSCSPQSSVGVHLKFNTGMNRLGFDDTDIDGLKSFLQKHGSHIAVKGVCTHLSHGEDILNKNGPSHAQLIRFRHLSQSFPGVKHAHKSATLIKLAGNSVHDYPYGSRPGIAVYGLPFNGREGCDFLRPVLQWHTELVRVHVVQPGESVSYSARWIATRRSHIGVLPIGYGDGYSRALSNRGQVLFRGRRVPVVGSVCMDYSLVDLTDALNDGLPQTGEKVVVLGEQGSQRLLADEIAEQAGTIAYEVVTAISARVPRQTF